ncbi:hypothetical protein ACFP6A_02495 [Quadrisphaera sp. GCM10027208]|uniref:hypothetical protein n=1 Tax=Quadrisphaera sp. GCM10027208 TaxID=3273423 RepID=UPI003624141E
MSVDVMLGAHADTTRLDIHEVVRRMNNHLGATVVAALAGSRDPKAPYRWAKPDGPVPRDDAQDRLRVAHRVWTALADAESEHTARNWFVGTNPLLDERSPVMALRDGLVREVAQAATAFLTGTWTA